MTPQFAWDVLHEWLLFPRSRVQFRRGDEGMMIGQFYRGRLLNDQSHIQIRPHENGIAHIEQLANRMLHWEPTAFGWLKTDFMRGDPTFAPSAVNLWSSHSPVRLRFLTMVMGHWAIDDNVPGEHVTRLDVLFASGVKRKD